MSPERSQEIQDLVMVVTVLISVGLVVYSLFA
jgi:hypothetical protein